MHKLSFKTAIITAAIMIFIVAAVFIGLYTSAAGTPQLVLQNEDTGKIIDKWKVCDGFTFSVEYIHSVNKTPVRDNYVITDGRIHALSTVYSSFGAGVQTFIEDGQTLERDENGNMVVSGFDITYDRLNYIIGRYARHTLYIGGEAVNLHEKCGNNTAVSFSLK